jgi:PhnB protein
MSEITCNPYIFFKGNCREAVTFYKKIFGGELTIQTYGEVGATTEQTPADYIMHADLSGGAIRLMASDTAQASAKAAKVTISLSGEDEEKLTKIFDGLSEEVDVQFPLKKQFWGDTFGSVTDKYGVDWMVNINTKKD